MTEVQARLEARRMFGDRADAWYSRKFRFYVVGPKGYRGNLDGCFTSRLSWEEAVEKAMKSTSDQQRGM